MLSRSQINEMIKRFENLESKRYGFEYEFDPVEFYDYHEPEFSTDEFSISVHEQYGGEDQGSEWFLILKFESSGGDFAFVKYDGHYSSWEGVILNDENGYLVEPVKRMVEQTFWEKIDG